VSILPTAIPAQFISLLRGPNRFRLTRWTALVPKIADLEPELQQLNDEQLRKKMQQGIYKSPYLKVSNLSQAIKDVFELSGFETYIETFDDQSAALKSF
jgi:preprotein translocase subunit SecA